MVHGSEYTKTGVISLELETKQTENKRKINTERINRTQLQHSQTNCQKSTRFIHQVLVLESLDPDRELKMRDDIGPIHGQLSKNYCVLSNSGSKIENRLNEIIR